MTPLLDIQRRFRELGRIRMGVKGARHPQKLSTWRLTSAGKDLLDKAAEIYGGEVRKWNGAPGEGEQWELITTSSELDIVVPPGQVLTQWYELWAGGGCKKRCDGQNQVLVDRPCSCTTDIRERMELAAKGQACKPSTRLNVILPKIPDMGVWRLETHGYHAASELAGSASICSLATKQNRVIPAKLRLDKRTVKRPGQPPNHFAVPVIVIDATLGEMLEAVGQLGEGGSLQLAPIERKALPGGSPAMPDDASFEIEKEEPEGAVEGGSMPGPAPAPEVDDVVDAEIVVEHPCPHCGSECHRHEKRKGSKTVKWWKCSNPDCGGGETDTTTGRVFPWSSFHNDPWKPGGEIETALAGKGADIPSAESSPADVGGGGQESAQDGSPRPSPSPSSAGARSKERSIELLEHALDRKGDGQIRFGDIARASATLILNFEGVQAPGNRAQLRTCPPEFLSALVDKLGLDEDQAVLDV